MKLRDKNLLCFSLPSPMGLQIEESDQELSARRRVQQLEQQGALRAYFSSANSNIHCNISNDAYRRVKLNY